ncbi:MAG: zinc ribbon domain-containing protein [Planctomycetes bacterium]|nr:zinc ribbon domain-containing protein [Planctomycetota bacterium]
MRNVMRWIVCVIAVFLVAGIVLAAGTCSKCGEKIESARWNFCPYCGTKLGQAAAPSPTAGAPSPRDAYEAVSWEKVRFEKKKYHNHKVRLTVRYTGIGHFFAPAERLGITDANYINFSFTGNRTAYVAKSKPKLIAKLNRIRPYTTIIIYGIIKVQENIYGRGDNIYIVLAEDIDVE